MRTILRGLDAGLRATVPMTVTMELLFQGLPRDQRYPLPPRLITERILRRLGADGRLSERQTTALTLAAHFAMGATAGAALAALRPQWRRRVWCGPAFGVLVWLVNYQGVMPALGLMRPVHRHPPHRAALTLIAHLVWGAAARALLHGRSALRRQLPKADD